MKIIERKSLKDLTTFRIGGLARFFCTVENEVELVQAIDFAREKSIPFFILGGGSNILVADEGFDGLVIKMEIRGIEFNNAGANGEVRVRVGAGENWDAFVAACVDRGFAGVENLSGIPGTVGAAPVQNIGAYGAEVSKVIKSVRVYDMQKEDSEKIGQLNSANSKNSVNFFNFVELSNEECEFGYRDSFFKKNPGRYIIVSVKFQLKKVPEVGGADIKNTDAVFNLEYADLREYFSKKQPTLGNIRQAVLAIRARKLPDLAKVGTAGSFFKNPIVSVEHFARLKKEWPEMPFYAADTARSAAEKISEKAIEKSAEKKDYVKIPLAWILDHVCGYKGISRGNVGTYRNQALVIVNNFKGEDENGNEDENKDENGEGQRAGATAREIKDLAAEITAKVKEKTGIDIEPEVHYVG